MKMIDGRYEVSIPWEKDPQDLPNNYSAAYKRLETTERSIIRRGQADAYAEMEHFIRPHRIFVPICSSS